MSTWQERRVLPVPLDLPPGQSSTDRTTPTLYDDRSGIMYRIVFAAGASGNGGSYCIVFAAGASCALTMTTTPSVRGSTNRTHPEVATAKIESHFDVINRDNRKNEIRSVNLFDASVLLIIGDALK